MVAGRDDDGAAEAREFRREELKGFPGGVGAVEDVPGEEGEGDVVHARVGHHGGKRRPQLVFPYFRLPFRKRMERAVEMQVA